MNDSDAILVELRKISAWADMQRKITRRSLICGAVFIGLVIPATITLALIMDRRMKTSLKDIVPAHKLGWYDVDQNVYLGEFDRGIRIGEELILNTPQQPEAHRRLAGAYLAAGKIDKAREHYAAAFRLFPTEENEKLLTAIDKRIKAGNPQPDAPANAGQPLSPHPLPTPEAAGPRR